jgi:RNA-directed DNA polymerase
VRSFDTLPHRHLRSFLDQRVRDGVIRRVIDKWLKAGVLEAERIRVSDAGVPQGSGVAPLLSNVFLHYVFDRWFEHEVQPRLRGKAIFYRFADDIAVGCATEEDAHRIMAVLPKRFGKYGLTLHPDKTRVLGFRRPPVRSLGERAQRLAGPESFDLLGFTHYWGRSRRGQWVIKRKTATGRLSRALKRINTWCRRYRHAPVVWQHQQLVQKLRGHYAYYGIVGNDRGLKHFRYGVRQRWQKWLNRRSQRSGMAWERFSGLLERDPLPNTRIIHGVPSA